MNIEVTPATLSTSSGSFIVVHLTMAQKIANAIWSTSMDAIDQPVANFDNQVQKEWITIRRFLGLKDNG